MHSQNARLIQQISNDKSQQLVKLILSLFSDEYLYVHKSFRLTIQQDRKGFVTLKRILQQYPLKYFFEEIWPLNISQQIITLRVAIVSFCLSTLHYGNGRVRRLVPFDFQKWRQIQPIVFEAYDYQKISISDIRDFLGPQCFIQTQQLQSFEDEIKVYSIDYRNHLWKLQNSSFRVSNYEELSRSYERLSKRRIKEQRKFYAENKYTVGKYDQKRYRNQIESEQQRLQQQIQQNRCRQEEKMLKRRVFEMIAKRPNQPLNELLRMQINKMELQ